MKNSKLDKTQAAIIKVLDGQIKQVDVISRELKMPVEQVTAALSLMELSGFVRNYGGGIWGR